jgi:glycolate oxidase FAD binding subunit
MNHWSASPLPLSAAAHDADGLRIRLSGSEVAITAGRSHLGGEEVLDGETWWRDLREHRLAFFAGEEPLWRLSVKSTTPPIDLPGDWLLDWAGAQRWLRGAPDSAQVRSAAGRSGGHASLFRGGDRRGQVFGPLSPAVAALHRRLKSALDPDGIFNPGRLYAEF